MLRPNAAFVPIGKPSRNGAFASRQWQEMETLLRRHAGRIGSDNRA
jgi:hypothetical protein